jgi:hypothetical protein
MAITHGSAARNASEITWSEDLAFHFSHSSSSHY